MIHTPLGRAPRHANPLKIQYFVTFRRTSTSVFSSIVQIFALLPVILPAPIQDWPSTAQSGFFVHLWIFGPTSTSPRPTSEKAQRPA
jgi:hypothetical protein